MNAMLEPRMVEASASRLRTHGRSTVAGCVRMTSSSHGLACAATACVTRRGLARRSGPATGTPARKVSHQHNNPRQQATDVLWRFFKPIVEIFATRRERVL